MIENKSPSNKEKIYIEFASQISFLEFIQTEFRYRGLDLKQLEKEIKLLKSKNKWDLNSLADSIIKYPKLFIIFQEIFQLMRFTNAQLIHFVFDVSILNSININSIFEYMIYNVKFDEEFRKVFLKVINTKDYSYFIKNLNKYDKEFLIACFKMAISKYVKKIINNFSILEKRILKEEFKDFSIRFANYLLNNLKLNEALSSLNIENFLKYKKVPLDTKSIHGKYMKIRIQKILEENGFVNIDELLNKKGINILEHEMKEYLENAFDSGVKLYCTEKAVKDIKSPKKKNLKKFDLIIFKNFKPKFLFEINFYSTEGTKIGINAGEYIDLKQFIDNKFGEKFKFYWITDGNYWLTNQGKKTFFTLLDYFDRIFNINIFRKNISLFF